MPRVAKATGGVVWTGQRQPLRHRPSSDPGTAGVISSPTWNPVESHGLRADDCHLGASSAA